MTIDDIIQNHVALEKQLRFALATMELKSNIQDIRNKIIENQKQCPHFSDKYQWGIIDDTCPYCGFHFSNGGIV